MGVSSTQNNEQTWTYCQWEQTSNNLPSIVMSPSTVWHTRTSNRNTHPTVQTDGAYTQKHAGLPGSTGSAHTQPHQCGVAPCYSVIMPTRPAPPNHSVAADEAAILHSRKQRASAPLLHLNERTAQQQLWQIPTTLLPLHRTTHTRLMPWSVPRVWAHCSCVEGDAAGTSVVQTSPADHVYTQRHKTRSNLAAHTQAQHDTCLPDG